MGISPDLTPDTTGALREVSESLLATQKLMAEDVADMAEAVTELTKATEGIANAMSSIDELRRAVEQLGDTVVSYTGKLGQLYDAQAETTAQLGRYISDVSKQQSGIREVDKRLRALEERPGGER